jgi:hypothetical protein
MGAVGYYVGRFCQLTGMWLLLVDVFTAGPLGPNPRLFAAGVLVFLTGWALTKFDGRRAK